MNEKQEFEMLKKTLDDLRIKKMSNEKELERSKKTLLEIRESIQKSYGVEPEDIGALLDSLKKEIEEKKKILEKKINEAKELLKWRKYWDWIYRLLVLAIIY